MLSDLAEQLILCPRIVVIVDPQLTEPRWLLNSYEAMSRNLQLWRDGLRAEDRFARK
jgi:hypothetical protein